MSELNTPPSAWWWNPEIEPAALGELLSANKGRLISLKSYLLGAKLKFAAFWILDTKTAWWWNPDVDAATLGAMLDTNKGRLISLDVYVKGDKPHCAGVWVKNEGVAWWWNPEVTAEQLGQMLKKNEGRLISLKTYVKSGRRLFAAIWVKNDGTNWWWNPNVDSNTLGQMLAANKGRLVSLDTYVENGSRRFAAVWIKNDQKVWWWEAGMEAEALGTKFDLFCSYPMDLVAYEEGGKRRLADVRYQYPIKPTANGIPGLNVTAAASIKKLEENGDQLNTIELTLQNTSASTIQISTFSVTPITSGGYLHNFYDPFAGGSFMPSDKNLTAGKKIKATKDWGSPSDQTHYLIQATSVDGQGHTHYLSKAVPILVPGKATPIDVNVMPAVYLGLWCKEAEIYPVWVGSNKVDWTMVAGNLVNMSGKNLRIAEMGMRLTWGESVVIEKTLPLKFWNWSDADHWWKELTIQADNTVVGTSPWAHFINGLEVSLPKGPDKGNLHVWLNYKLDGFCQTATWDSTVRYVPPVQLQVPVTGRWRWGNSGNHSSFNGHTWPGHRHDIDLVMVDENGKSHKDVKGDPANKDFFAFGKPVHCMKKGKVVKIHTDSDDNLGFKPFSDPLPEPNHVLIRHDDGSLSAYYHFKKDSIVVGVGDAPEIGAELGKVGNSGGSGEPHLHIGYTKPTASGRQTLWPMTFSGLFTIGSAKAVKGHPGADIYQSNLP